jgi:spermidine synthase
MAGMALGNAFAASSRVQRWRPLRLYAFLELVIAFLGCTIVFGLPLLGEWLRPVFQTLWNYQSILLGLRFVLSFLVLLLPATAMGLTLPVLMEDSFLQTAEFGRAIGILYGVNTLGAVTGALVGEAYLVEAFGLLGTAAHGRRGHIHCRSHGPACSETRGRRPARGEISAAVAPGHHLSTTLAFTFC